MSQLSKIAAGVSENQRHREANLQLNMRHSQQSSCLLVQYLGKSDLSPRSWQINYFFKLILKCLKEWKEILMMYPDKIISPCLTELLFWASSTREKKENSLSSESFLLKSLNWQKFFPTEKNGNWNFLAMHILHSPEKHCVWHCRTCHGQWHSEALSLIVFHKVNNRRSVNSLQGFESLAWQVT